MKFIIAGGGIGGLVTAIALKKIGHEVRVFESVEEIKPLGVGINLLPHCVRVLTNLGLQNKIAEIAVETKELVYANRYGQLFWSEPRGRFAGYKWPQFSIHRGKFQMLLWEEALKAIGKENLYTNAHLTSFEQDDQEVRVQFVNKQTGENWPIEHGDVLIGADGIHSELRKILYPNEGGVVYSGNVLYRGTTKMKGYLTGASMAMIGSLRQKMVIYPIVDSLDPDGNQLINWVGNLKMGEEGQLTVRDWNRQADKDRLMEIYKNWQFDWINVHEMIANAESIYEFPMSDRDPLDKWSFGRVTLLGDAAHPMYPIGSNGASQAILDTDALIRAFESTSDPIGALRIYDAERVPAAALVVNQNRQKGPDFIMDLMEDRFPDGFQENEIPHEELAEIMLKYKQIAGFDIQTLNAKH
ncbi:flavin-dependent oxidoreductase [Sandaracinomonas limnophila]|uniref:Flavin-dependent oxidoreductase n=1 Tax=Sandaracinomonas limnophila TaxID=1862386 RepID=A0A437PW03_9BACT|nr:flavin-dependent oxidoreductase [Sandaracinomonas limnophila]RVU26434.1 flavin-dependent oxidoreductase [Sandaracinomonas limnophila]